MHLKSIVFVLVAVFATQQGVQADWWMNLPYGNQNFNHLVLYGENVTLDCNDTFVEDGYRAMYWIRSDLKVMMAGDVETFWTIDGTAGWRVNQSGEQLHVFTVQENQFGFYHCVLNNTEGSMYVVKKAINFKGPYFGNLWPKYRRNTIIAGGSAGGFLVLAIIILLICKFKFDPDEEDDEYSVKDADLEDPVEGTSSSRSGSIGDDVKKSSVLSGPQVYVNDAFDVEKGVDTVTGVTSGPNPSETGATTDPTIDPTYPPEYTTTGLHKRDVGYEADTTAF